MTNTPNGHQAIRGSERAPVPGTKRTGPANPKEVVTVTVRLRRRPNAPQLADMNKVLIEQPPHQRKYISREEFGQRFGADPADVSRVEKFASDYGLTVGEVSEVKRIVKLT